MKRQPSTVKKIREDLLSGLKSHGCTKIKLKEVFISDFVYEINYEAFLPGKIHQITIQNSLKNND